jgi:hypothetical protein
MKRETKLIIRRTTGNRGNRSSSQNPHFRVKHKGRMGGSRFPQGILHSTGPDSSVRGIPYIVAMSKILTAVNRVVRISSHDPHFRVKD